MAVGWPNPKPGVVVVAAGWPKPKAVAAVVVAGWPNVNPGVVVGAPG